MTDRSSSPTINSDPQTSMRFQTRFASKLCFSLLALICGSFHSHAANSFSKKAGETDALAKQLLDKFDDGDQGGVLVMDSVPSFGEPNAFGSWFSDQLALSLVSQGQNLTLTDRSHIETGLELLHATPNDQATKNTVALARSLGANTIVVSTYGFAENGIGVTLTAFRISEFEARPPTRFVIGMVFGKMPLTRELSARLGVPLDTLKPTDGVYKSGSGGVSVPVCIKFKAPEPHVPDIDLMGLLRAHPRGAAISMQFIVMPDGHVRNVTIITPIGFGFDEQLTKTAADWEFTPAIGPDGKIVPVTFPFQFMFNFK